MAKSFLKGNESLGQKTAKPDPQEDRRYEFADRAMAKGGYAKSSEEGGSVAVAPSSIESNVARSPTSWSSSKHDRSRLNKLRGELMLQGIDASGSKIIALALKSFADKDPEERVILYKQMFGD